jgi:hypothetical protein
VDSPLDSLFTYRPGESWITFYDPYFLPTYTPTFSTPEEERQANMICGGDTECLFDVAVTGRVDIGQVVVDSGREIEEERELLIPGITCDTLSAYDHKTILCLQLSVRVPVLLERVWPMIHVSVNLVIPAATVPHQVMLMCSMHMLSCDGSGAPEQARQTRQLPDKYY